MHPHAELPVKLGGRVIPLSVLTSATGFFGFFAISLVLVGGGMLALT